MYLLWCGHYLYFCSIFCQWMKKLGVLGVQHGCGGNKNCTRNFCVEVWKSFSFSGGMTQHQQYDGLSLQWDWLQASLPCTYRYTASNTTQISQCFCSEQWKTEIININSYILLELGLERSSICWCCWYFLWENTRYGDTNGNEWRLWRCWSRSVEHEISPHLHLVWKA